MYSSKMRVQ